MAGVSDDELATQGPWPAGVDNVSKEQALQRDENGKPIALREAVNVDLDATGRPQRRSGYETQVAQPTHSLHATSEFLFAVVEGALQAYSDGETLSLAATIRAGLGDRFVSYADHDDDTYWSNGVVSGRIDANLSGRVFWLDTPDPPVVSVAANGALAAGSYEVSITVTDVDGRESGASSAVMINVPVNGGIALVLPAVPAEAAQWRIFVSAPDGDVLYHAADVPIAASSVQIGHGPRGAALKTAWLFPLLPSEILRHWNGRLLGASGNVLVWSEAYRIGLMHADNHMRIGERITLMEPVGEGGDGAGVFVADHKRTYFLSGGDPKNWAQVIRYSHPAVPGTSLTVPGNVFGLETTSPVAFWLASNGVFCIGLPGGQVQPLRETTLALPVDSERGASGFFAFDGIRQIVTSVLAGGDNPMALGDSASATIRRNGVTL